MGGIAALWPKKVKRQAGCNARAVHPRVGGRTLHPKTERDCVEDQSQQVKALQRLPVSVLRLVEADTAAFHNAGREITNCFPANGR